MTATGYECIRYDASHRDAVLALQSIHWGPDRALNARYLDWKYVENPWADVSRIYLVMHGGELIGMRGLYGSRWEAGTPTSATTIPCAGDLVIAPEHRARGVFTMLMDQAMSDLANDGPPLLFNLSAGPTTRLGSIMMGWHEVGPLDWLIHEVPPRGNQRQWFGAKDARIQDHFRELDQQLRGGDARLDDRVVASDRPRPAAMADLVRRRGHDGRIRHVRDEAYFAWRFRQPLSQYRFLYLAGVGEEIDGYLVLQCKAHGQDKGVQVVDCESDEAGMSELLRATTERCGLTRIIAWRDTVAATGEAALQRLGFIDIEVLSVTEYYPAVLVMPNASATTDPWLLGGRDVRSLANWDLRQAYGDGA